MQIVKKSVSLNVNTLIPQYSWISRVKVILSACNINSFRELLHSFNVHICVWIIYHAMYKECTFFVYNQALQKKSILSHCISSKDVSTKKTLLLFPFLKIYPLPLIFDVFHLMYCLILWYAHKIHYGSNLI